MLTVLSWNVRSLRDSGRCVAAVVRRADPDVLLLQEAPRFPLLCWWPLFLLRRRTGLRPAVRGRPLAGLTVLVRPGLAVQAAGRVLLSPVPGLHRRGVAWARVDGLVLATTHLDLDAAARVRHAAEVLALLPGPLLIAGDLNEQPDGAAWALLAAGRVDAGAEPTFPARRPRARIDAVLVPPGWSADVRVLDGDEVEQGSDHRPLLARLSRLPG